MARKPAYKRILGRRIVSIEQSWWPAEPCRGQGVWGVDAIVLDDGARIVLETIEREDFYTVRMVRVPKEVSDVQPNELA